MPAGRADADADVPDDLTGTLGSDGITPIANGKLRGDEITFTAGGTTYTGRVNGNAMQGTITGAGAGKWSASKVK